MNGARWNCLRQQSHSSACVSSRYHKDRGRFARLSSVFSVARCWHGTLRRSTRYIIWLIPFGLEIDVLAETHKLVEGSGTNRVLNPGAWVFSRHSEVALW